MEQLTTKRQTIAYITPESVPGVLEAAGSTQILVTGLPDMSQDLSFTASEELRNTLDIIDRVRDRLEPGTFNIGTYCRPSGNLALEPQERGLLQALFPNWTLNPGNGIFAKYQLSKTKGTVSIWWAVSPGIVFFAEGCLVSKLDITSTGNKGYVMFGWGGTFRRLGWAATSKVVGSHLTNDSTILVANSKLFAPGAQVTFGADATVYTITEATEQFGEQGTITINPPLEADVSANAAVNPYLPAPGPISTTALPNRDKKAYLNGSIINELITDFKISIVQADAWNTDESTASGLPEAYAVGDRSVTGSVGMLLRGKDLEKYSTFYGDDPREMSIVIGETEGNKLEIKCYKTQPGRPKITEKGPVVGFDFDFTALGVEGEDSVELIYR